MVARHLMTRSGLSETDFAAMQQAAQVTNLELTQTT
jgi:hypothetical protein